MSAAMTRTGNKKRTKKIKVHYDRLIVQLIVLVAIVFGIVCLVSKCAVDREEEILEREQIHEAVEAARRDADRVINTAPGSMERDERLLFIKSQEYKLRSNGHGHAADDYILTVKEILRQHGIE